MKKFVLISVALLGMIGSISAQTCHVRPIYNPPAYVAPTYYPQAIITEAVAIPVPAYFPIQAAGPGVTPRDLEVLALRQELEVLKLRSEVQALRSGSVQQVQGQPLLNTPVQLNQPQALKAPNEHPAIAVFKQNCYSCHSATKRDGGLDLTAKLTDRQLRKVSTFVYTGHMPKNGKITDQAVGEIIDWVDKQE